jgi:hypothetical protein
MKARNIISLLAVSLPLVSGSIACGTGAQPDEPTAQTSQDIITTAGAVMAWPMGPVTWNGLVGTWPIAVWSPATIGTLAFGINGVSSLGVSVAGLPALAPVPITPAVMNAFVPPVAAAPIGATPFLGTAGLWAPAYGYTGAYAPWTGAAGWGVGLGAFAPYGAYSATLANGAWTTGLNSWWVPTLTTSSLMFTNMAAINTFTPFTFNLTFQAASAAQATAFAATASMASLSIFATPILPTAFATYGGAIPFMSIAYPILPMPLPAVGFGAAAVAPIGGLGVAAPVAAAPVAAPLL